MNNQSYNVDYFSEQIKRNDLYKSIGLKKSNFRDLGIPENNIKFVKDLETLRQCSPNIIIAQAVTHVKYTQNDGRPQSFVKKNKYVMSLSLFESMQYDPTRRYKKTHKPVRILKPAEVKFKNMFKPYTGQSLENKTLLIWRTGGIGDLLFIKPNLDFLKEKYPSCKIKFACGPQYRTMVENWKCIDEVLNLPFNFKHLMMADYHCVFEGVIERTYEAHKTNAYILFSKWMGVNLPVEKLIPHQIPEESKVRECENILHNKFIRKNEFILVQVRASSPPRTPNPSFWIRIIDELTSQGHQIVLTDMPSQAANLEKIKAECKNKSDVFIFARESKSLSHLIALTSLSRMTLSPDSSLIHLAASLGIPCFGVYGPFPGKIRLSTYTNCDWVDINYECGPCFVHNHRPCSHAIMGYSPCFSTIDFDICMQKIQDLLNG